MVVEKATDSATSAVHHQHFSVSYEFPVHFTEDLFDQRNPVLRDTLGRLEPEKRHRLIVFIDDGLTKAMPDLKAEGPPKPPSNAEGEGETDEPMIRI